MAAAKYDSEYMGDFPMPPNSFVLNEELQCNGDEVDIVECILSEPIFDITCVSGFIGFVSCPGNQ